MSLLSSSQLSKYINNIKNLEISCYQLNRLHSQLNSNLTNLSRECNIKPEKPPIKSGVGTTILTGIFFVIIGVIICAIISIPVSGIYYLFTSGEGFWDNFIGGGCDEPFDPYLFRGLKIACVIGIIGGIVVTLLTNRWEKSDIVAYKEKENARQNAIKLAQNKYEVCLHNFNKCEQLYKQTMNILQQYYSLNIVYPKYRGLVPMCTISEYLDSGRCSTLTGHEGAYNLYESELRMNIIIGKLDDIIYRLDDIRDQQFSLYRAITDSNSKIDNMCNILDETRQNTALSQYYSGVAAANTTYLAWKQFLK